MNLRLSRIHYPVTVLGHGRRVGIWFQGCTIGCAGCMAQDTWTPDAGMSVPVVEVLDWIKGRAPGTVDGVTISGGEPFEQPAALSELLDGLHEWRRELDHPVDLLCFSGFALPRLKAQHGHILDRLDVVVPEPFLQRRPTELPLRGSANQRPVCLTDLGTQRYATINDPPPPGQRRRLQVAVDGDTIWYIGIPARGDLERLTERMQARGVVQEQVSWSP